MSFSFERTARFLNEPRYRRAHLVLIAFGLLMHLGTHYATYVPSLRTIIGNLPYFRLHVLHEAEFLVLVFYSALVFRWKGGATALAITAVTSVPFLLTPYIFGRDPRPDEIRDNIIQVGVVLFMGGLMVWLYEVMARERERRIAMAEKLEALNRELNNKLMEIQAAHAKLEATNRQLNGLNGVVQRQLNQLYGDLQHSVEEEQHALLAMEAGPAMRDRFNRFVGLVASAVGAPSVAPPANGKH
jgi:hypothetical protein